MTQQSALEGIKVVDLTAVLMGPSATQILGDFGADVVKVEPIEGESGRYVGIASTPGLAASFLHVNRNKRSIALDLKHPQGREALLKLVETADVLIYNVRPQAMQRLGLAYADIAKVNPRIVYCGVFGFGEDGPYSGRPAYDDLIQAATGMSRLMAEVGDGVPRYVPVLLADRGTGQAAVSIVLAALLYRERTGRGQAVEVPMFETMATMVLGDHMAGATFVPDRGPMGYRRVLSKSRVAFRTQDAHVAAVIYLDKHWKAFFQACGQPERMENDPRLRDLKSRTENIDALYAEIESIFSTRTTAQWLDLLLRADIPAAPVHSLESLLDDPHLNAVGFFRTDEHPAAGPIRTMAPLGSWSETPSSVRRLAPRLGEHTEEILRGIGYDDSRIAELLTRGVTRTAPPLADS